MGLAYLIMAVALIAISVIDIKWKVISMKALLILLFGGIAAIAIDSSLRMIDGICAMVLIYIVLWIIHLFSKGSFGMGDVKLCAVTSLYLGIEKAFSMLAFSMLLCGVTAAILIVIKKENKNKSLPFAPFVTVGTLAMLLL